MVLTPQERASLLIQRIIDISGMDPERLKYDYDNARSRLSDGQKEALDKMVQSLVFGDAGIQDNFGLDGTPDGGFSYLSTENPENNEEGPNVREIKPNIGEVGSGESLMTGPPPMSALETKNRKNIKVAQFLDMNTLRSSLEALLTLAPQLQGVEEISNLDVNLETLLPELRDFLDRLPQLENALNQMQITFAEKNKKLNGGVMMSKNDAKEALRGELLKEALKADIKSEEDVLGKVEEGLTEMELRQKRDELAKQAFICEAKGDLEQLAKIEDSIRYLDRDWTAFKSVNVFPEQEEGTVEMGYAKPEFNMGKEHIINPMNVLEPEGKIPDMKQFPAGDDPRTKQFKDAKPGIPMAEDGKGTSSITKVVEEIDTVKVLDETEDVHQKTQPAVPDQLPKLAASEKGGEEKYYIVQIAGKYEKIKKIVFPPTGKDPDGHFPINTEKRAHAALTYVNQYQDLPPWAKKRGIKSLKALVNKVVSRVKKEYPGIEISEEARKPGSPESRK